MTNQEINEAIAKECGWEFVDIAADSNPEDRPYWHHVAGFLRVQRHCPDFSNDLNAMHEAEKTLDPHWLPSEKQGIDDSDWEMYVCELSKIADRGPTHATARQRAEAFLKVNNL